MNYGRVKLWIETQFCGCINRVENNLPCVKENFGSSWFLLRFLTPTNLGHLSRDTCWVPWGLVSSSRELRPNWSSTWETQRDRATPDRRFYSLWPCLPDSPAPPSRPCFSALPLGPSSRAFLSALPLQLSLLALPFHFVPRSFHSDCKNWIGNYGGQSLTGKKSFTGQINTCISARFIRVYFWLFSIDNLLFWLNCKLQLDFEW